MIKNLLQEKERLEQEISDLKKELAKVEEEIENFLEANPDYEDEEVVVITQSKMTKKVDVIKVLEDDNVRKLLVEALKSDKITASVSIKFEKMILGVKNYSDFFNVQPTEKKVIKFKEE